MQTTTPLAVPQGLPWSRTARVLDATAVWPTAAACEAHGAVVKASRHANDDPVLLDLTARTALTVDGPDLLVTVTLTGADTRALYPDAMAYEVIVSDLGDTDAHAVRVLHGPVQVVPAWQDVSDEGDTGQVWVVLP